MKKRKSVGKTAFVIMLAVFIIVCIVLSGTIVDFIHTIRYASIGGYVDSKPVLNGTITMDCIGKTYKDNAKSGYTYYQIHVPIQNQGNCAFDFFYHVGLDVEGEEYGDVYSYGEKSSLRMDFRSCCNDLIPPGLFGTAQPVYLIRDGVKEVYVTYYEDMDDYFDRKNGETVTLTVPE